MRMELTRESLSRSFLLHYEEHAELINQLCQKRRLRNSTQGSEGKATRIRCFPRHGSSRGLLFMT